MYVAFQFYANLNFEGNFEYDLQGSRNAHYLRWCYIYYFNFNSNESDGIFCPKPASFNSIQIKLSQLKDKPFLGNIFFKIILKNFLTDKGEVLVNENFQLKRENVTSYWRQK